MLVTNVRLAIRSMWRHPVFALINILGLGLGLFASFMVLLWVQDELSYDRFYEDPDDIYQVMLTSVNGGTMSTQESVTAQLEGALRDYPEIEYSAVLGWERSVSFVRGERAFRQVTRYAGPDVFQILTFPFLAGDPASALTAPESVVLSETAARAHFPEYFVGKSREQAAFALMGENLRLENRLDLTVTGVVADAPANSSVQFDVFLPFTIFERENSWVANWGNNSFKTYVRLAGGADPALVGNKIRHVIGEHMDDQSEAKLSLQSVQDRYLWSRYDNGVVVGGRIDYVRIMGIVGILILLIAAINFTNLATARSAQRAREIGVRKTFGGSRGGLAAQFMSESVAASAAALVLAVIAVILFLPSLNSLTGKSLSLLTTAPSTWIGFVLIAVLTGLVAGVYPAAYLSGLGVMSVFKKRDTGPGGGRRLRRGLVVFQFSASMLLVVGTLTVYQQIQFIQSANLGLDRNDIVSAKLEGGARESWPAFSQALLQSPAVRSVTYTDRRPLDISQATSGVEFEGKNPDDNTLYYLMSVGPDYVETFRMEMVAGRTFDSGRAVDSANVIINETAARKMGFENPIGQRFSIWGRDGEIIGVVKDFHMQSMYGPIEPTILRFDDTWAQSFFVRAAPGQTAAALSAIGAQVQRFSPGHAFEPEFMDAEFDEMYRSEQVIGTLANWFAILAVTIACLGLYGLASFTTSRRIKEIGVRKVLGASVWSVANLLTREFAILVGASFVLATPVAWFFMRDWLATFEYHVQLGLGLFVVAGAGMLLLTYATVGLHTIRAAQANPAQSLRSE